MNVHEPPFLVQDELLIIITSKEKMSKNMVCQHQSLVPPVIPLS